MALPIVEHYHQLKDESLSLFAGHKRLVLVSVITSVFLVLFGIWAMRVRANLIAGMNAPKKVASSEAYIAAVPTLISSSSAYSAILGTSSDLQLTDVEIPYYPPITPYPVITNIPLPTTTYQAPAIISNAVSSCVGTPTEDNSQVYVSPSTTSVGSSSTITIDLRDCNNSVAPVSDSLSVVLASGDTGTKINGASSPVTIETKNGKVSFTVNSQNATTATFLITDTTRSFPVTMPGYKNPTVTFSSNTSGNSNCTTAAGVPNFWYSEVSPTGQQSASVGSTQTYSLVIRDCNKNIAPVSDSITISLNSGDPSTQVNGNNLPVTFNVSNGQASFSVLSTTAQTVTLSVKDTTSGFPVTDSNNHNPSVVFTGSSGSSATPTPTPTPPTATNTPMPTPTPSTATQSGIINRE